MSDWSRLNSEDWGEEPLDPEVFKLCEALNNAGFITFTSCSGHGFQRPMVWFEHSNDERIEEMSRFVIAELENSDFHISVRIRKQIYKDLGDYDWSIEVSHWDIYSDTPHETALKMFEAASDKVAELINSWYNSTKVG
jgi:hypothetical protein